MVQPPVIGGDRGVWGQKLLDWIQDITGDAVSQSTVDALSAQVSGKLENTPEEVEDAVASYGGPTGPEWTAVLDDVDTLKRPHHIYAETSAAITTASADIATALQSLLNAYEKVEFRGTGTYLMDGPVEVSDGTTLIIPDGVTLKLKNGAEDYLLYITGTGRVVGGGTLDGNRANQTTTAHGVVYVPGSGRIKDITVINGPGNGIVLDGVGGRAINCDVSDCDSFGILSNKSRQRIERCTVEDTGGAGIRATGSTATGNHGTQVLGNSVEQSDPAIICIEIWGESAGALTRTVVSTNTTAGGDMGISLSTLHAGACTGNTTTGFATNGIELAACQHCTTTGNAVDGEDDATCTGIVGSNSNNAHNAIGSNTIRRCGGKGIYVIGGSDYAISGNVIADLPGTATAIYLQNTDQASVTGNQVNGATWAIYWDGGCTQSTIAGNVLIATNGIGLVWGAGSYDHIAITGNTVISGSNQLNVTNGGTLGSHIVIRGNPGIDVDYLDYANNVIDLIVTATPEAAITAGIGSLARHRTTGAIYRKTSGTGNTGWVTP